MPPARSSRKLGSMVRIAALLVCLALAASGCGSSSPSTTSSGTAPTSTIEGNSTLQQMPKAPEPTGAAPSPASASAGDERAYLRAVFNDAQGLWQREFAGA